MRRIVEMPRFQMLTQGDRKFLYNQWPTQLTKYLSAVSPSRGGAMELHSLWTAQHYTWMCWWQKYLRNPDRVIINYLFIPSSVSLKMYYTYHFHPVNTYDLTECFHTICIWGTVDFNAPPPWSVPASLVFHCESPPHFLLTVQNSSSMLSPSDFPSEKGSGSLNCPGAL